MKTNLKICHIREKEIPFCFYGQGSVLSFIYPSFSFHLRVNLYTETDATQAEKQTELKEKNVQKQKVDVYILGQRDCLHIIQQKKNENIRQMDEDSLGTDRRRLLRSSVRLFLNSLNDNDK